MQDREVKVATDLGTGQITRADKKSWTERNDLPRRAQYRRQMQASVQPWAVATLKLILTPLFSRVFKTLDVDGFNELRELLAAGPVVLAPTHRSHFDYLLLTYFFDRQGLRLPYIIAGDNLNFFPAGFFLRRSGGLFIRRSFNNDRLYQEVFENYVSELLEQGKMLEVFIEGGRTRSGILREPKLGFLKTLVGFLEQGKLADLKIVPISINYDRVIEETDLAREFLGQSKPKESIFELLESFFRLFKKESACYIRFQQPLAVRDFILQSELRANIERGYNGEVWHQVENLAQQIITQAEAVEVITTRNIFAAIWSFNNFSRMHVEELYRQGRSLADCLQGAGVEVRYAHHLELLEAKIERYGHRLIDGYLPDPTELARTAELYYLRALSSHFLRLENSKLELEKLSSELAAVLCHIRNAAKL
ncbi:glycerol-3-phosphate acyltransferase [bacterium]|nr:glycerol-3-phosphate acyltransferase [bacterium]